MFSTYRITGKGQHTRSILLQHLHPDEELTRDHLVARSGLTYEQVRRQTKNLCIEGTIESRTVAGQRYYRLRRNFMVQVSSFLLVCLWGWSVPVRLTSSSDHPYEISHPTLSSPATFTR
ncbi:MAG TPA: hypothetical protein V6C65_21445 [Allocoleopsis sp.]